MKVFFGQIYISPGVSFDFSHAFQVYLGEQISQLVTPSAEFVKRYGADYELMFRISAKRQLIENEIRGPTVFKKDKDVEYTIFLPFDVIHESDDIAKAALYHLFTGVLDVFGRLSIDTARILEIRDALIERICQDKLMIE